MILKFFAPLDLLFFSFFFFFSSETVAVTCRWLRANSLEIFQNSLSLSLCILQPSVLCCSISCLPSFNQLDRQEFPTALWQDSLPPLGPTALKNTLQKLTPVCCLVLSALIILKRSRLLCRITAKHSTSPKWTGVLVKMCWHDLVDGCWEVVNYLLCSEEWHKQWKK